MQSLKNTLWSFVLASLACCMVAGCASMSGIPQQSLSYMQYPNVSSAPRPDNYQIDIFFNGQPEKPYDILGEINGTLRKDADVRSVLEAKARQVGGDAVIDIDAKDVEKTVERTVDMPQTVNYGERDSSRWHPQYAIPASTSYHYTVTEIKAKVVKYR